ncbi:hypothetical protein PCCS19_39130 [Paenibacillus sp. CCS19]|uniref:hypothetical protein n=1 Tax=Paenibacillus sp. CCS19 TaxID=3158387 RepID=UPI0025664443|nr:hypothetical protein [Paenibacillus cellulosilyticus]GMK40857.1 hypothetical protein PCCS19_39130 [Paenibacillus cellulosilyticus]
MTDDKRFDEVEDLVSLEALAVMDAALSPDENAPPDDIDRKYDNQLLDTPKHPHSRDDLA